MPIIDIVNQLRQDDSCEVLVPSGLPSVGLPLPPDVKEFYQLCGGATLFDEADYSIDLVAPLDFVRANPVIAGEDGADDISFDWFVIAKTGEQYITIDLNQSRSGRCYDSYWDRHGVAGECQVVAISFESLLEQLFAGRGEYWYWLHKDFQHLGDAYD